MAEYTTQMDAARQGLITEQMRLAAEHEGIAPEELRAQLWVFIKNTKDYTLKNQP